SAPPGPGARGHSQNGTDRTVPEGAGQSATVAPGRGVGNRGALPGRDRTGRARAGAGAAPESLEHPAGGGTSPGPPTASVPTWLDAEPGRRQGAGAVGGRHASGSAPAVARLPVARGASSGTAAENHQSGPNGDDQGAARLHAPATDAGHSR